MTNSTTLSELVKSKEGKIKGFTPSGLTRLLAGMGRVPVTHLASLTFEESIALIKSNCPTLTDPESLARHLDTFLLENGDFDEGVMTLSELVENGGGEVDGLAPRTIQLLLDGIGGKAVEKLNSMARSDLVKLIVDACPDVGNPEFAADMLDRLFMAQVFGDHAMAAITTS
jgi:hypothetical protein